MTKKKTDKAWERLIDSGEIGSNNRNTSYNKKQRYLNARGQFIADKEECDAEMGKLILIFIGVMVLLITIIKYL